MYEIVGYAGYEEAYPVSVKELRRPEYRNCDSAGRVAVATDGGTGRDVGRPRHNLAKSVAVE